MRKIFVIFVILVVFGGVSSAGVKPFVEAYFSTSLFQNVDDKYLREHYGPYRYGEQYGDNRWYLRDSRLSFIFGLGVKGEGLFGSVDFYVNSFLDGSTFLDINSGVVGYSDDILTVKGFFKSRAVKFRNSPSEMFFSYLPSFQLFSSTFSRGHWFIPYFLYPLEFIDGSVEVFSTAREDTTNLVYNGKDYYGVYVSYFDGLIDIEGYFARNIYDSIGIMHNVAFGNLFVSGNFGGARVGGAGNIGFGDIYFGVIYREMTTNNLGYLMKTSDYRWYYIAVYSSNKAFCTFPYVRMIPPNSTTPYLTTPSYTFLGGYFALDLPGVVYIGTEGGILKEVVFSPDRKEVNNIYFAGGVLYRGGEGLKLEFSSTGIIPETTSNVMLLEANVKTSVYSTFPLISEEDEIKCLAKVGLRDMKVGEPSVVVTSLVGVGNVGYIGGDVSLDVLGYINNNSSVSNQISTNILYSDLRLYFGYRLSSLFGAKARREIGDNFWLKVGGRGFVQVGNVNVGNVGENTILTPYVGLWYQIPRVDSYVVLSYGWYGMMGVNDLDLGRNLEAVVIMYNGGKDFLSGLMFSDNIASTLYSDGKYVNTGEYKLAVEPVVRFDMYIKY